jgi:hypothetical protein
MRTQEAAQSEAGRRGLRASGRGYVVLFRILQMDFRERPKGEVRRIHLPRISLVVERSTFVFLGVWGGAERCLRGP